MSEKQIQQAKTLIKNADAIVVGMGSGLSASGGLDYTTIEPVKKNYPEYYEQGYDCIFSICGRYWSIDRAPPEQYWSFWARHIKEIRYDAKVTQPYNDLAEILKGRNYFVINTNVDGQYEKSNLDQERCCTPQGNYRYFQCEVPCTQEIYDNKELVEKMVKNMVTKFALRKEDIPRCPHCGKYLIPNLRSDDKFVEKPYMPKVDEYWNFINENKEKKIVFLELGVGFNSPGVIRSPFDYMTYKSPNANLIRINFSDDQVPKEIINKTVMIKGDLKETLEKLKLSFKN